MDESDDWEDEGVRPALARPSDARDLSLFLSVQNASQNSAVSILLKDDRLTAAREESLEGLDRYGVKSNGGAR